MHFHLKTHPTREKDETRFLGREIHPYQPDPFPPILCYISLSGQQDEPPQLTPSWQSPFTIRLHEKPTKTVKTYKSLCSWVAVHKYTLRRRQPCTQCPRAIRLINQYDLLCTVKPPQVHIVLSSHSTINHQSNHSTQVFH